MTPYIDIWSARAASVKVTRIALQLAVTTPSSISIPVMTKMRMEMLRERY
jgi:hypothetical protein